MATDLRDDADQLPVSRPEPASGAEATDGALGDVPTKGRAPSPDPASAPGGGTAEVTVRVPAGVRVGHWTGEGTGVTVVLPPPATTGSGEVRGGAPATREFELLRPERMVDRVDAVVLSGGSAFGLAAADGVMHELRGRGEGFPTAHGPVPIVVGMSIFDASVASTPPDAAAGRAALRDALSAPTGTIAVGRVGAGTGAVSGRWYGRQDPGGFGAASALDPTGATVTAFAVVNALGSVIGGPETTGPAPGGLPGSPIADPGPAVAGPAVAGPAVAGPAVADGVPTQSPAPRPVNGDPETTGAAEVLDRDPGPPVADPGPTVPDDVPTRASAPRAVSGEPEVAAYPPDVGSGRENTTLVVVVTDATLSKTECLLLAQSGHDGMARALHPSHTRFDGDAVVSLATGSRARTGENDLDTIRATAIEVVAAAIRNAVSA
ncbi:P1 family peptidase [Catenuloplanes sp. NPDC051500]|uniref:P1 family peptidase n=1 Tax=Catenuloplanes sp. NPDC051500 TaxID=3363959 RepID=UPI0037B38721